MNGGVAHFGFCLAGGRNQDCKNIGRHERTADRDGKGYGIARPLLELLHCQTASEKPRVTEEREPRVSQEDVRNRCDTDGFPVHLQVGQYGAPISGRLTASASAARCLLHAVVRRRASRNNHSQLYDVAVRIFDIRERHTWGMLAAPN